MFAFAESRKDWDNLSNDLIYDPPTEESEKTGSPLDPSNYAYKSLSNCRRACKENTECFQYLWDGRCCKLGRSFKLGGLRETAEGDVKFTSGWDWEGLKSLRLSTAAVNNRCGSHMIGYIFSLFFLFFGLFLSFRGQNP